MAIIAATTAVGLTASACGESDSEGAADNGDGGTLILYNAQHEELAKEVADAFTERTGIAIEMRNGDDSQLANQLIQEGDRSPADLFFTENSPGIESVANRGLFTQINDETLANVPEQYRPSDGDWTGWAARSTVFVYNTSMLSTEELPASILDLARPEWRDRFGIAPGGADFQAIVSAVLSLRGEQATREWLNGLKANARIYQGNSAIMRAANAGEIEGGLIYHYYVMKDRAESGENSNNVELQYFGNADPGAFVSVSGVGILNASERQEQAQQFVEFLTSEEGQQILARSTALEYPVASGVPANSALRPLPELGAPQVDPSSLDGPKVVELMQEAGLI